MTVTPASWPDANNSEVVVELSKILPPANGGKPNAHQTELLREQLGSALKIVDQMTGAPIVRLVEEPVSEKEVRTLLRLRRNRDLFFESELFADPAWDMLLELYAAELGQLRMSVGGLCAGAAVPATTALRWISQLEDNGLIARKTDPRDGRRHFLSLSQSGLEAMNAYFRSVPAGASLI